MLDAWAIVAAANQTCNQPNPIHPQGIAVPSLAILCCAVAIRPVPGRQPNHTEAAVLPGFRRRPEATAHWTSPAGQGRAVHQKKNSSRRCYTSFRDQICAAVSPPAGGFPQKFLHRLHPPQPHNAARTNLCAAAVHSPYSGPAEQREPKGTSVCRSAGVNPAVHFSVAETRSTMGQFWRWLFQER
nr:hypothetical protein CFP56_20618 [Quercus suber]